MAQEETKPTASSDGLSALAAKVLDQLSLTSWLPAALLTAGIAVLFQFRTLNSIDLPLAVSELAEDPFQFLVLVFPLLVIATVITQAFSFSAIRMLEGYWRRGWLANLFVVLMTKCQERKKKSSETTILKYKRRAFKTARERMLSAGISVAIVCSIEELFRDQKLSLHLTDRQTADMDKIMWKDYCNPWQVSKLDHLEGDLPYYPRPSRLLPTTLGNKLRATEDNLLNTNGDLEGFILGRWSLMPQHLRIQHDEFRDRLEMYCTLVFVAIILSGATILVFLGSNIQIWQTILLALSFLALAAVSYSAAITSAAGYCTVLKQVDDL
ncbi:hypothetical protein [Arthrobacter sp. A5]|uniref:hypothetical protein n=1 Tax=Arthrobacter sp. A5 TaxID=576926 RepID=UPI003DA7F277